MRCLWTSMYPVTSPREISPRKIGQRACADEEGGTSLPSVQNTFFVARKGEETRQHLKRDGLPLGHHKSSITFTIPDESRKSLCLITCHSTREHPRESSHSGQSSLSVKPWSSHTRPARLRVSFMLIGISATPSAWTWRSRFWPYR